MDSIDNIINDWDQDLSQGSIEGTLYMIPGTEGVSLYANPVYQSEDGRIFVTSSDKEYRFGRGETGHISLSKEHTSNGGNYRYASDFSVRINIEVKVPDKSVHIIHMNADNMLVLQEQYTPDTLPGSVTIYPDTEYVIIETRSLSKIDREIFNGYFTCYKAREDGFLETVTVNGTTWWEYDR